MRSTAAVRDQPGGIDIRQPTDHAQPQADGEPAAMRRLQGAVPARGVDVDGPHLDAPPGDLRPAQDLLQSLRAPDCQRCLTGRA
jgi:hypothetical protein